jgi:hypothetical protein
LGIPNNFSFTECNYPGPNWKKGTQPNWAKHNKKTDANVCRDIYISNIPWANDCGMVRKENDTHVTFTGQGTVSYDDPLPPIDGQPVGNRQVSSVIKFALAQPKVIRDITTTVTILDEPRLLGAVTRQQFDLNTGLATLSIALSLAAPLRTAALLQNSWPPGLIVTPVGAADNALCRDVADVACQQRYTFTIDPKDLCKVDGNYTFTFSVACHPSIAGTAACPTSMTTAPLSISVQLQGEDICAVVQGVLQVGGTITPHGEFTPATFAFGPLKTAFFQDQTLHFQVTANSINAFPFASSRIILVEAQDKAGVRQKLYDTAAGGPQEGWTFSFASDPANAGNTKTSHKHQFNFIAAPGKFGDVERNKPIDSDVVVAVEVTFVNPIGPGRKRVLTQVVKRQAQNTKTANAQARIQLAAVEGGVPAGTTVGTTARGSSTNNIIETDGAAALVVPSLALLAAAQLF